MSTEQELQGQDVAVLNCSFCGKSQTQVRKLIAGPGVYICDECIELCNEIITEEHEFDPENYFPPPYEPCAMGEEDVYVWTMS